MKRALIKIALLGSRGIPARYSGFETFYEQLAIRLVSRGHEVTVYNRSHFIRDVKEDYQGVRIISLPSISSKHLDTITHTFISSIHALFQQYDIIYYCIVGNSPLVSIARVAGSNVLLNVDGEDWAREKWSGFARWYQRKCEWVAARTAPVIISDARSIQEKYLKLYGVATVFVPYGANIMRNEGLAALDKWGLSPDKYILYVGRFVPENGIDLLINAYRKIDTDKNLVIVGDAVYMNEYRNYLHGIADERVIFTGFVFGEDYAQLSSHASFYVQPSGINGTRPALLDQLAFGNCVLVRNSDTNMEVIGNCGCSFDKNRLMESLVEQIQELVDSPNKVAFFRSKATSRIQEFYNWEWITDFYIDLFMRMMNGARLISYDEFLKIGKAETDGRGESKYESKAQ